MAGPPERCAHCAVRDAALCAALADDELSALSTIGRRRTVPRGQVLSWAGEASMLCANLVAGVLKLTLSTGDGREQIVGLLFPGDFVGEPFAEDATITATALTEADLCFYPRVGFAAVLDAFPRVERLLLRRTMHSLEEARARMLALARASAGERVAGFLRDLPARLGADASRPFALPLSRGEMADVLGLTIETVSRQLTALKSAGIIALAGARGITIVDAPALAARAEAS